MDTQQMNTLAKQPLTRYGQMAQQQWKAERPLMYARLEAKGKLRQSLIAAQQMCKLEIGNLMDQGYQLNEAEEVAIPMYLFLPSEQEMPRLGQDPSARNNPPPNAPRLQEGNQLPDESYPQMRLRSTTSGTSTPTIKLIQKMLLGNQLQGRNAAI